VFVCFKLTVSAYLFLIGFQNKNRVAILAELDKEKKRLIQSQSMNNPGARYCFIFFFFRFSEGLYKLFT